MKNNNYNKPTINTPVAALFLGVLLLGLHKKKKARKEKELAESEKIRKLEERINELENK
jgi:cytochrome c-type biogenesis protein CcmH/NrfF